jgi:hypothetical protein
MSFTNTSTAKRHPQSTQQHQTFLNTTQNTLNTPPEEQYFSENATPTVTPLPINNINLPDTKTAS